MNIVHLTPGTGNFHCGSCLRDHALVKELVKQGHQVTQVPLYLPFVLDGEDSKDAPPVFLGGVNLFLQEKVGVFRKTPRWLDKYLDSKNLLLKAAEKAGMTSASQLGKMSISSFEGAEGRQAKEWLRLIDWISEQTPKPDVISLSNGLLCGIAKTVKSKLGIPVVCTLQGEDTFMDTFPEPLRSEAWEAFRKEAQHVDKFLAVSTYHAELMRERLGLPEDKVVSVPNGIDLSPYHPADEAPAVPTLGYIARLHPAKGLHTLVDAFIELKRRDTIPGLILDIAGAQTASDLKYVAEQRSKLERAGVVKDATIRPNISLEEKADFLRGLSVLSVPAAYGESFGLYVIEALASGVPTVQPDHAAFPEVLGRCGGGKLYSPPEDPEALADALEPLLVNQENARTLGRAGYEGVHEEYSAAKMASRFAASLLECCPDAKEADRIG